MDGRMVSPNEIFEEAKKQMLDGREPETRNDWCLIMNFFACNVAKDCAQAGCRLLAMIFDIPLSNDEIDKIVEFQISRS